MCERASIPEVSELSPEARKREIDRDGWKASEREREE